MGVALGGCNVGCGERTAGSDVTVEKFLGPSQVARHFGNVQLYYMEACVGTSGSLLSVGGRGISS